MGQADGRIRDVAALAARIGVDGPEQLLRFPKYLQIETVSRCNAHCVMCPVDEWQRSTRLMDDRLFAKIADELAGQADWIEEVCLQLDGEPLIDKSLASRVRRLKAAGINKVVFASNGSLMTRGRAEALLDSGLDSISFSIDGAQASTYEAIRLGLNFDAVVANVLAFIAVRDARNAPCRVRIRMVLMERNRDEFSAFRHFWASRLGPGDGVYGKEMHHWAGWLKEHDLADGPGRAGLNDRACHAPWSSLVILSDGRVPLCCSDFNAAIALGDVNASTIAEIWRGQPVDGIRAGFQATGRRSIPMCVDCTVWDDSSRLAGEGA